MSMLMRLFRDEEGQGLAEYAVILAGIVVLAVGVVVIFGEQINAIFGRVGDNLEGIGEVVDP